MRDGTGARARARDPRARAAADWPRARRTAGARSRFVGRQQPVEETRRALPAVDLRAQLAPARLRDLIVPRFAVVLSRSPRALDQPFLLEPHEGGVEAPLV